MLRAVPDKTFGVRKDFSHEVRRCSFGIGAQQWLRPRGAEKDPGFGAVSIRGSIKKELNAVRVFFFQHTIAAQAFCLLIAGALNRILLDVFWNVQVAPTIIVRTEFAL